ncbi:MAG: class I SAM-dependent methyltransferase [Burkholderiales bacterium]|nr:class I SAM-dependent methyltransferase [Burkholderiales bacterium]
MTRRTDLFAALRTIVQRHPRAGARTHERLGAHLEALGRDLEGAGGAALDAAWSAFAREAFGQPCWVAFLLPDSCTALPDLLPTLEHLADRWAAPPELRAAFEATFEEWIASQSDIAASGALGEVLLRELGSADPGTTHFLFLSRYYTFLDLLSAVLFAPASVPLLRRVFAQLLLQRTHWPHSYCQGYAYQGWERIGIGGIKPTEQRLALYDIDGLLGSGRRILDIGSNCGFLALELAQRGHRVDGIELNPWLVGIATEVRDALDIRTARFFVEDFRSFRPAAPYDAVFSLANHATIDGRSGLDFEHFAAKLFELLEPGGLLLFESHNVFGPGTGGPGDDGDLDRKLAIAGRYFETLRHRMTHAFVPFHDVDKLFVVLRRRSQPVATAGAPFDLAAARQRYAYGD